MQKRILLIDDEDSLRRSLSIGLTQNGYEVEPCENGINALKKLDQYHNNKMQFDGIILDIKLPDIDGITLGKMIGSKFPGILIFLITGFIERYDKDMLKGLKIQALIEKPFSADELSKQIEKALKTQKAIKPAPIDTAMPKQQIIKSVSAYALVNLKDNVDFMDVYKELYFQENTLYCDTTNGDYDIILLIQADSIEKCRETCNTKLKRMKEVSSVELLEIKKPVLDESIQKILDEADIALSKNQDGTP